MNGIFEIKNKYLEFKENLSNNIKNYSKINESQDCYLIGESWLVKLKDYLDNYDNAIKENENKIDNELNYIKFLQKNCPEFINNFSTAINHLKNEKQFK